jgi:Putative Actinobacterial Holin-X, holin superfamily III
MNDHDIERGRTIRRADAPPGLLGASGAVHRRHVACTYRQRAARSIGCDVSSNGKAFAGPDKQVDELGNVDLVSGIVDDARDLIGAHVEVLRDEMTSRLTTLGATLSSMLIAIGVFVVTAIQLGLAIAASIVALGATWWAALWIVTLAAGAIGVGFVVRARTRSRTAGPFASKTAALVREDIADLAATSPSPR